MRKRGTGSARSRSGNPRARGKSGKTSKAARGRTSGGRGGARKPHSSPARARGGARGSRGVSRYQARLARLREAGFKSEREWRRAKADPKVAQALAHLPLNTPKRYELAGMIQGRIRLAGAPASPERMQKIQDWLDDLDLWDWDPGEFFDSIGSPKKGK